MKRTLIFAIPLLAFLLIGCSISAPKKAVMGSDGLVKIPLSELSTQVRFYQYNNNGVNVRYFAVLGSDGQPRVAFDACDVCGPKGYTQVGNKVQCNNCGKVFDIDGLGTENKNYGCWPRHLSSEVKDNNIVIKSSDLEAPRKKFGK